MQLARRRADLTARRFWRHRSDVNQRRRAKSQSRKIYRYFIHGTVVLHR